MGAVLLSAIPLVLSLSLPNTSRHSLTPAMASPMSWDVDRSLNTDTSRRIVWHQSSHCWVVDSVGIGELGLCIGRLFKCVIVLWMACSSSSLTGEGFVRLCCPYSALFVPWSILHAAVVTGFSALSACSNRSKRCRETLASSWSLSLS